MSESAGDYQVGYKKPPLHTRFKKGQIGNPRGQPPQNLASLVNRALKQKIVFDIDGKKRRVSTGEAVIAQLVHCSTKADLRATKILLDLLKDFERRAGVPPADPPPFVPGPEDEEVLAHLVERLRSTITP
jgi:hypothetical protein